MLWITRAVALVSVLGLAACAAPFPRPPSVGDPVAARYSHAGPTELVLFNIVNTRNARGEHAALMINGSERVLFDPAGSWYHPTSPFVGDVHFGFNDPLLNVYIDYHASEAYYVTMHRVQVPREVADQVIRLAVARGEVPRANCARSIGEILRQVPGFENAPVGWWPNDLAAYFNTLPGVQVQRIDSDRPVPRIAPAEVRSAQDA
jgi:hypothetical protein